MEGVGGAPGTKAQSVEPGQSQEWDFTPGCTGKAGSCWGIKLLLSAWLLRSQGQGLAPSQGIGMVGDNVLHLAGTVLSDRGRSLFRGAAAARTAWLTPASASLSFQTRGVPMRCTLI